MQAYILTNKVVVDSSVRELCRKPYPNHPKGCPNFGNRSTCPPRAPFIEDYFDLTKGLWIVWIDFKFAAYVRRMERKHPDWSQRQKECCLYWQGTANRMLKDAVADVEYYLSGTLKGDQHKGIWKTAYCPEAMGVNVTATMKNLGVTLEWPPQEVVRKVAIIGVIKNDRI